MTYQEIDNRIKEIWNKDYSLPKWVKDRGYVYADPIKADVLITGINPSFRESTEDIKNANTHGPAKYNLDIEVWKKRNNRKWHNQSHYQYIMFLPISVLFSISAWKHL